MIKQFLSESDAIKKLAIPCDCKSLGLQVNIILAPRAGLEPATYRLTAERSTN